jgi:hypothetical protein
MSKKTLLSAIVLLLCVIISSCEANTTKETMIDNTFVSTDTFSTSVETNNTEFTTISNTASQIATTTSSQINTTIPEILSLSETTIAAKNENLFFNEFIYDERRYENCLEILDAMKQKDEETLKWLIYYPEGKDGWLYNVDIIEYELLSYNFGSFFVELIISKSNDDRFPLGNSRWQIHYGNNINYPLSINLLDKKIANTFWGVKGNSERKIDEAVIIACAYTTAFEYFADVNDIAIWTDYLTADRNTILNYLSSMRHLEYNNDSFLTEDIVNTFFEETLGISDTSEFVNREFLLSGYTNDYLRLEDLKFNGGLEIYTIDDFYNNNLILTFYADSCFLTPAITMQYNFSIEQDELPQLLSVKVLKDYGYEPVIVDSLSFG